MTSVKLPDFIGIYHCLLDGVASPDEVLVIGAIETYHGIARWAEGKGIKTEGITAEKIEDTVGVEEAVAGEIMEDYAVGSIPSKSHIRVGIDIVRSKIPSKAKVLFGVILNFQLAGAHSATDEDIANKAGMTLEEFERHLTHLEAAGFLKTLSGKPGKTNRVIRLESDYTTQSGIYFLFSFTVKRSFNSIGRDNSIGKNNSIGNSGSLTLMELTLGNTFWKKLAEKWKTSPCLLTILAIFGKTACWEQTTPHVGNTLQNKNTLKNRIKWQSYEKAY